MRQRQGFTLIEMLVATALIIFIMVIMTQAFSTGMDALRYLKTIGDMQEKLRTATTILRRDLAADHFEGKRRLSDPSFWTIGPPREGFFRIWQGSTSSQELTQIGQPAVTDGDSIASLVATNHCLHFTVKRRGNRRDEFASAVVPNNSPLIANPPTTPNWQTLGFTSPDSRFQDVGNTFSSQWYEVAYFLVASPGDVTPGSPGVQRYTLYRRQRLAVTNNYVLNWNPPTNKPLITVNSAPASPTPFDYAEMSCEDGNYQNGAPLPYPLYFNSPNDVAIPQRRFGMDQTKAAGVPLYKDPTTNQFSYQPLLDQNNQPTGSDLLLTDVLSFDVQVMFVGQSTFTDIPVVNNASSPLNGIGVFDTWSSVNDGTFDYSGWATTGTATSVPLAQSIKAIQITIRIWDIKTQQTRQITLVQDM